MKKFILITLLFTIALSSYCFAQDLFDATKICDTAKMNTLIEAGANPLVTDQKGFPLLFTAVESGCSSAVRLLIKNGVPVDVAIYDSSTALMLASMKGKQSVVNVLLSFGAEVNRSNASGGTPLIFAAQEGYVGIVKILLAKKADINAKTTVGGTALYLAYAGKKWDVVDVLMAAYFKNNIGSNVNRRKAIENAIMTAARKSMEAGTDNTCEVFLLSIFPPDAENKFYKIYAEVSIRTGPSKFMIGYVDYYECSVTRDGKLLAKAILK